MPSTCLFCKIAAKEIPANILYEDERFIAFHDIKPAAPVHFLIIPKQHRATLAECSEQDSDWLGGMLALAPVLAKQQGCDYQDGAGGYRTLINTGPDGGQEVYHLHMHIIGGAHPWKRFG